MMTNTLLLPLATAVLAASFAATTAPGGAPHDDAMEAASTLMGADAEPHFIVTHESDLLPTGGGYDLTWHTIDGGGGTSSGGGFMLSGTIGQPDAGVMSNEQFTLAGGFWAGGDSTAEPQCPVVGDLNCDGVVDVLDLLVLLDAWGECADCGLPGGCPADLNGDCTVDVLDLLLLLDNWG
jgi:hypothetical protein